MDRKKWHQTEKAKAKARARRALRREAYLAYMREYHKKHKAEARAYYHKNKKRLQASQRRWKKKNRAKLSESARVYRNRKYATDPEFRLRTLLRTHTRRIQPGHKKKSASLAWLGGTIQQVRAHIESLWLPGMTWANHSLRGWHIDHIRPLASFDFTDPNQIACAMHYTNLQPLWAKENLEKGKNLA